MNIKEIDQYVISKEEDTFYRELNQDDLVVVDLLEKQLNCKEAQEYLKRTYSRNDFNGLRYFIDGITTCGDKIIEYHIGELSYRGFRYNVNYKNVNFVMFCLQDGTINKAFHTEYLFCEDSSWKKVSVYDTIEEMYQGVIWEILVSKNEAKKYYNNKISELRKELKYEMELFDKVLCYKGEERNGI